MGKALETSRLYGRRPVSDSCPDCESRDGGVSTTPKSALTVFVLASASSVRLIIGNLEGVSAADPTFHEHEDVEGAGAKRGSHQRISRSESLRLPSPRL